MAFLASADASYITGILYIQGVGPLTAINVNHDRLACAS